MAILDSELWISDGTTAGTKLVKDINPGTKSSGFRYSIFYNGKLYFNANNGTDGDELWESDGTTDGTKLVKDIFSGANNSNPSNFVIYNNKIYFHANDGINGRELWGE